MEFTRKPRIASPTRISTLGYLDEKYPSDLSMYSEIPTEQLFIEEFQEMAIERVKFLRVLETSYLKSVKGMTVKDVVINEMSKQNLKYFMPLVKGYADPETRRRDYLSHFILRLSYCHSEELRRWFINRELEFFKLKFFNLEKKEDILLFMEKNNLNFSSISDEEKKLIAVDLFNSTAKNVNLESTNFFKVQFTQVLDLVRSKKVFVKSGFAYVSQKDLISILMSIFKMKLSQFLAICSSNIHEIKNDERLSRILKGLDTSYTGNNYCLNSNNQVSLSAIESFAVKSFPLCMKSMYETFKTTHHLKYLARLQFGLFLKGIGVSLEDSLKFWKEGFTKKADIDSDTFEKRYSYSIRHSYGTEGKRVSYMPHNCMKIINTSVGSGENHGCPFKQYDMSALKLKLMEHNFSAPDISIIIDYASKGHYQLACTKYFEITHNVKNALGINHPNMYFEESQKIINEKLKGKNVANSTTEVKEISGNWGEENIFDLNITSIINNSEQKNN